MDKRPSLNDLAVGEALPERSFGPVTRTVLALFAGGSGDHNPIHINIDFAKKAGMPDVFAHGMLSMAYLGRYLAGFARQDKLRRWSMRFVAITPVNATVICSGALAARDAETATLKLTVRTAEGIETMIGEAIVALD
jgi:acyl dehydratase